MKARKTYGQQPQRKEPKKGARHPLLLNQRFSEQNFWPCILIIALSAMLLLWNPRQLESYHLHLAIILTGTGTILILTLLFRLRAYVQCTTDGLRVQLPFYHLTIPYHEIKTSRPSELVRVFPAAEQRWTQRRFLRPIYGRTVIVLELDKMPVARPWLRLWMSKYMFFPHATGIILPVRDWLAFQTDLDEHKARRRESAIEHKLY